MNSLQVIFKDFYHRFQDGYFEKRSFFRKINFQNICHGNIYRKTPKLSPWAIFSKDLYSGLIKGIHKYTDKYRSLTCFCCLSMLISLVLGYKKYKKSSIGIYSEGLILRKKIYKKGMSYTQKGGALFWGFYGIL